MCDRERKVAQWLRENLLCGSAHKCPGLKPLNSVGLNGGVETLPSHRGGDGPREYWRMASYIATAFVLLPVRMVAQAPQQSTQPGFTLRASTNLVIVDVVVSDGAGRPVHGLKASDFTVKEDGKPQALRNFQEHSSAAADAAPKLAPPPKLAPGLFTNNTVVTTDGPANVLLLDMLNTPLRDQNYARQQIAAYLNKAPANSRIAIFGLANSLSILQGFTSDPELLKTVLASKSAARLSSQLNDATGGGGGDQGGATALSDSIATLGDTPDIQELVANAQQFEAETQTQQQAVRAQITLDALNELAHYLSNIPGRKNLIWFSGSFPVSVTPNTDINNGFMAGMSSEAEFRETMALLARNQVSLYPVDVRGLQTTGTYTAANSGQKYAKDYTAMGKDLAKFDAQVAGENGTMLDAAKETGGRAFINTNGLTAAVAQAVEDGSNYYTVTYSPVNKAADGKYRKLEVAVSNKESVLAYRRGYYADESAAREASAHEAGAGGSSAAGVPASAADNSAITRSMMRGAPASTQIEMTVRVRTATGAAEQTAAAGNEVMAGTAEGHPPYLRYTVDFAIDPRGFVFDQTPGAYRDSIQFIAFVYDANGTLISRTGSTMRANFSEAVHADFLRHLLSYNLDISAPEKGSYFLRLAVQDGNSQRVGALEVPLDAVRKLPPLVSVSAAPVP